LSYSDTKNAICLVESAEHFLGIGSTIANVATYVAIDLEGSHFGEENSDIRLLQVKFDNDPLAYVIDVHAFDSSLVFGSDSWFKKLVESNVVTKFFFDGRKDVLIMNQIYGLNVTNAIDVQLLEILARGPVNDLSLLEGIFYMPFVNRHEDLFKYVVRLNSLTKAYEELIGDDTYILLDKDANTALKKNMNNKKEDFWNIRNLSKDQLLYAAQDVLQIFYLAQFLLDNVKFHEDYKLATFKYYDLAIKRGFSRNNKKNIFISNSLLPLGILKNFPPTQTKPLVKCPFCFVLFSKSLLSNGANGRKYRACLVCKAIKISNAETRKFEKRAEEREAQDSRYEEFDDYGCYNSD
jgi:hypothetical protein